ncbi:DUF1328 domain-containing protein [Litorimonas sp. WD9-15]|uniref:DUF1328 domain-containing protein n=1 Tax=Litorimonas sp. WD9-15 TaxID=3418716 RepID=UPI003D066025
MLRWAIIFLVVAIIAGALGFGGIAAYAKLFAYIAGALFLVFLVLHFISDVGRGKL